MIATIFRSLARAGRAMRYVLLSSVVAAGSAAAAPPPPAKFFTGRPAAAGTPSPAAAARAAAIAPAGLLRALRSGERRDFFVHLEEHPDLSTFTSLPRIERGRRVYDALRTAAERSQAPLRAALSARGVRFKPYWISNGLLVQQGDLDALYAVAGFAAVARVAEPPQLTAGKAGSQANGTRSAEGIPDNLRRIGADRAWAQGTTGAGVTIGFIDTGADPEHEALHAQYRGTRDGGWSHDYNWLSPQGHDPRPYYTQDIGQRVMSIAVGDNRNADPAKRERIGVAPSAQWIACLGVELAWPSPEAVMECFQFMLAPTRTDGTQPDPDRRPDIVNGSWSMQGTCDAQAQPFFKDAIDAWAAAGIVPVFSTGDAAECNLPQPPGLGTIAAPASLAASFAVGSSDANGRYAEQSTWGPTAATGADAPHLPDPRGFPQLKPQVVAPGVDARAATIFGGGYTTLSGSAAAAPHVAGTFALMIEAGECLRGDYRTLGTLLMQTARPIAYDSGGTPAPGPGNVPNHATGWGEIDAFAAVNAAANACGPQGFVRGTVHGPGGRAIAGATVDISTSGGTYSYTVKSDIDGSYVRRLPALAGGGYTVRVSAYGYLPASESGVLVAAGADTRHDVALATAPVHTLTGRITDAATGWPLHARIAITGHPGEPAWTDPLTGAWSMRLPEGTAYRLDVTTEVPGYRPATREIADVANAGDPSLALQADPVACEAPGYAFANRLVDEGFENNGTSPPAGWTRSSAGIGWQFGTAETLSSVFVVPPHGRLAASNDQLGDDGGFGNDAAADFLVLPPLNLAGIAQPALIFSHVYPGAGRSQGTVEGSRDGGTTWTPLAPVAQGEAWSRTTVSLAPLAGSADARVRFHADDGGTGRVGSLFAVDDVLVAGGCRAPAQGGLVVGHVRDANTGVALDGAQVSANGAPAARSYTSADAQVGTGFFVTHAAAGQATLTAQRGNLPAGYQDAAAPVAVSAGKAAARDLALPAGRLRLHPQGGPRASVPLGGTAVVPFTVTNTGTAPLAYAFEGTALVEHFDGDALPPAWTVANATPSECRWAFVQQLDNMAGGDTGAVAIDARTCSPWEATPVDSTLVLPPVDLSDTRSATVSFYLAFFDGLDANARLDIDLSTDGGATWSNAWSATDSLGDERPAAVDVDITRFAGSADTRVRFRLTGTPPWAYVYVDQVHVMRSVSGYDMIDLAPDAGTLAPGATRALQATFDARGHAQPGTYSEEIRVVEDTPDEWFFDGMVRATIDVTAPPDYGWFDGIVRGLGACDAHPAALAGATVELRNARGDRFSTVTGTDGRYRYWLPAGDGPFMLVARAAGHRDADARSATLSAGGATAADFDLPALLPCLMSDPGSLVVDAVPGQPADVTFDLMNGGNVPAAWTARVGGDPAERVPLPVSQTVSGVPARQTGLGCGNDQGTAETWYLRVFPLDRLPDPAEIVSVSGMAFAVGEVLSATGTQAVDARLYKLRGELRFENLQLLREKTVTVDDAQALQRVHVPFEPLALGRDAVIVAAVHAADGREAGNAFTAGFSKDGESAPGYIAASLCNIYQPTPIGEADPVSAGANLIIELDVDGSAPCDARATPVPWLSVSPATGTLDANAAAPLTTTFAASAAGSYRGTLCVADDAGTPPLAIPVGYHVGRPDTIFRNGFE